MFVAVVQMLHTHNKVDGVAVYGAIAIYNLSAYSSVNKQRFMAAGARTALKAIRDDPSSSAEAKCEAADALGRLS